MVSHPVVVSNRRFLDVGALASFDHGNRSFDRTPRLKLTSSILAATLWLHRGLQSVVDLFDRCH